MKLYDLIIEKIYELHLIKELFPDKIISKLVVQCTEGNEKQEYLVQIQETSQSYPVEYQITLIGDEKQIILNTRQEDILKIELEEVYHEDGYRTESDKLKGFMLLTEDDDGEDAIICIHQRDIKMSQL